MPRHPFEKENALLLVEDPESEAARAHRVEDLDRLRDYSRIVGSDEESEGSNLSELRAKEKERQ
jgi:hypothetical protein